MNKCIECGKFLKKTEELICSRCQEKDLKNEKLQELIKTSIRVR